MIKHDLNNTHLNINLLLPLVAKVNENSLIMIIDSTYLDKTEFIEEEAGDLEFF